MAEFVYGCNKDFFCKSKCWDADFVENIFERSQLWLFVLNCHELIRICCLILWFSSRTCTSEGSNSSLWKQKYSLWRELQRMQERPVTVFPHWQRNNSVEQGCLHHCESVWRAAKTCSFCATSLASAQHLFQTWWNLLKVKWHRVAECQIIYTENSLK